MDHSKPALTPRGTADGPHLSFSNVSRRAFLTPIQNRPGQNSAPHYAPRVPSRDGKSLSARDHLPILITSRFDSLSSSLNWLALGIIDTIPFPRGNWKQIGQGLEKQKKKKSRGTFLFFHSLVYVPLSIDFLTVYECR